MEPFIPEVRCEYLAVHLFDVGPVMAGGMGPAVLSHGELAAWQANTGVELQPWELRALRRLSAEFIREAKRAEEPGCPAPCSVMDEEYRAEVLPKRIRSILRD